MNGPREHSNLAVSSRQDMETVVDGDAVQPIVDLQTQAKIWRSCLGRRLARTFTVNE
jgi:hypothetical protein